MTGSTHEMSVELSGLPTLTACTMITIRRAEGGEILVTWLYRHKGLMSVIIIFTKVPVCAYTHFHALCMYNTQLVQDIGTPQAMNTVYDLWPASTEPGRNKWFHEVHVYRTELWNYWSEKPYMSPWAQYGSLHVHCISVLISVTVIQLCPALFYYCSSCDITHQPAQFVLVYECRFNYWEAITTPKGIWSNRTDLAPNIMFVLYKQALLTQEAPCSPQHGYTFVPVPVSPSFHYTWRELRFSCEKCSDVESCPWPLLGLLIPSSGELMEKGNVRAWVVLDI